MYCTNTPEASRCPPGTYSGDNPISSSGGCTACPAGFYCPIGAIVPVPCPPGTVQPSTNMIYIYDCLAPTAGTQATIWANSNSDGDACTAGHYCPLGGSGSPTACPAGTYTDSTTASSVASCLDCPAGYACEEGTGGTVKLKLNCGAGYYCPLGSSNAYQYPCPAGTYSANIDNTVDTDCTSKSHISLIFYSMPCWLLL